MVAGYYTFSIDPAPFNIDPAPFNIDPAPFNLLTVYNAADPAMASFIGVGYPFVFLTGPAFYFFIKSYAEPENHI